MMVRNTLFVSIALAGSLGHALASPPEIVLHRFGGSGRGDAPIRMAG